MNKESKKVLRRKLIVFGIMLAVLFGAIAVAGIVKRGDYLTVAHAEEVNPTEWEVVSSGNRLEDVDCSATPDNVEFDALTYNAQFKVSKEPGFFSYTGYFPNLSERSVSVSTSLYLGLTCSREVTHYYRLDITKDMVSNIIETVGKAGPGVLGKNFTYYSGFTFDLSTLFDKFPDMVDDRVVPGTNSGYDCACTRETSLSAFSGEWFNLIAVVESDEKSSVIAKITGKINTATVYKLPPAPTKEGYRFTGWYTDEACTVKYEGETFTDDITLYAGFEPSQTFTVTFIDGDYTHTETVSYGESVTTPTRTKNGYNFIGWLYSDNTKYSGQEIKSDVVLTAQWAVKMLKVRFIVDGEEYKTVDVPYRSAFMDVATSSNVRLSQIKSVTVLKSIGGVGSEDPAEDQSSDYVTSDMIVEVKKSQIDSVKDNTSSWFKTTWEKIASFFVNLWAKISGFFVTAWEAVCNHFRNNWKWYAIGGGSAVGLAIVIAVICKVRR